MKKTGLILIILLVLFVLFTISVSVVSAKDCTQAFGGAGDQDKLIKDVETCSSEAKKMFGSTFGAVLDQDDCNIGVVELVGGTNEDKRLFTKEIIKCMSQFGWKVNEPGSCPSDKNCCPGGFNCPRGTLCCGESQLCCDRGYPFICAGDPHCYPSYEDAQAHCHGGIIVQCQ